MNLPILPPPSLFFFLFAADGPAAGTTPPIKLIPPPMPDDVAGSPHPPVPNLPATFDLPGLAVGNGDGLLFASKDYHVQIHTCHFEKCSGCRREVVLCAY